MHLRVMPQRFIVAHAFDFVGDGFAVEEMTFLIDSIVTAIVALLVAAIDIIPFMAGPEGVLIGIFASIVVLFLGKDKMQEKCLLLTYLR